METVCMYTFYLVDWKKKMFNNTQIEKTWYQEHRYISWKYGWKEVNYLISFPLFECPNIEMVSNDMGKLNLFSLYKDVEHLI